jgi:hypothetical protein
MGNGVDFSCTGNTFANERGKDALKVKRAFVGN